MSRKKLPITHYDVVGGRIIYRLGDSEVFCTIHGRDRLEERSITLSEVIETLAAPDRLGSHKNKHGGNLLHFIKKLRPMRTLHITIFKQDGKSVITTAFIKETNSSKI